MNAAILRIFHWENDFLFRFCVLSIIKVLTFLVFIQLSKKKKNVFWPGWIVTQFNYKYLNKYKPKGGEEKGNWVYGGGHFNQI